MSKQKSIIKLAGRVDDQSFYYSKNGGYQMRKINPGMSSRVKNGAEYANTRLNNAEFGAAGSVAGAIIRGIAQRWRFILTAIATGTLVKHIKDLMANDYTSEWGKRIIAVADMPSVQEKLTSLSKNAVPAEVLDYMRSKFVYDSNSKKVQALEALNLSDETIAELKAKGADGAAVAVYGYNVLAPQLDAEGKDYLPSTNVAARFAAAEGDADFTAGTIAPLINAATETANVAVLNETTHFGGMLVVVLPYRKVGSGKYTLQELCSAAWVAATAGTVA